MANTLITDFPLADPRPKNIPPQLEVYDLDDMWGLWHPKCKKQCLVPKTDKTYLRFAAYNLIDVCNKGTIYW